MKTSKKVLIMLLCITMLLSMILMISGCSKITADKVESNPTAQVLSSIEKTKAAIKESNSASPINIMLAAFEKGAFTLESADEENVFSNVLYIDQAANSFANMLTTGSGTDKTLLNAYGNKHNVAISYPQAFGGQVYGFDLSTIRSDLQNSAIWSILGVSKEEGMESLEILLSALEMYTKGESSPQNTELLALIEEIKTIRNQCVITVEEKSVIAGNDMAKAINVTFTMTTAQLNQIADLVIDYAGKNYADILTESPFVADENDLDANETAATVAKLKESVKTFLESSKAIVETTISLNPSSELIMKAVTEISATTEEGAQRLKVTLDLGEDPTRSAVYKLRIGTFDVNGNEDSAFAVAYERLDSKGVYDRRLRISTEGSDGDEEISFRFAWYNSDKSYTLTADLNDEKLTFSGTCKYADNKLDITVDSVKDKKGEAMEIKVRLVFEPGKSVPEMPQYKNVLKMTEDELRSLIETMDSEEN